MNNKFVIYGILGLILIGGLYFILPNYYGEHQITSTVLDKERVVKDQSSYYLIYTESETLTIQDTIIKGQWESSDLYGHIKEGQTYTFTVYGWRSGFFSMYRNIISYEEV